MSMDSTAATHASESDSDLSSYSNWSVLDDSDNGSRYARKIRLGGKKVKAQSKTKIKPPKANKKFDIEDEIFMMEDVLSKSSSEASIKVLVGDKEEDNEESFESFEEILPEPGPVCKKDSIELHYKRKNKDHLEGSRSRNISIINFMGLLLLMTSFSWITAMFGAQFLTRTDVILTHENIIAKISDKFNATLDNSSLNGIKFIPEIDLPFKLPGDPTVVILPPEDLEDPNITNLEKSDEVKPHFHNDGKVTFGPSTYKDYLNKQKNKLEEMKFAKEASSTYKDNSESLSKTVSDILKNSKSECDKKFECCSIKKRLGLSKKCQVTDKKKKEVNDNPSVLDKKFEKVVEKSSKQNEKLEKQFKPINKGLNLDFNGNKIDDIINNFNRYIKKNALSAPKEKKSDKILPRAVKDELALHKIAKNDDLFKQSVTKHKNFTFKKIKDCLFFRIAVCIVVDIVALVTIRKLGIVCIGQVKNLMGFSAKPKLELAKVQNQIGEIKRVDMFKILPFHRTKARAIRKAKKQDKVEKTAICNEGKLVDKTPKPEYPSDYYLFMLSLKMKALDQNVKSRADPSALKFGMKRYSTEFKQSLIKQLSGIYKDTVKNDKLREDLVFCIMKIYECKFEYAPTCAYATTEALNRLDKFKALLVDYYRYQDNPLVNTKYLKSATAKLKEDLGHVLELMLEDQKLGATRSNIECTCTADNSTFKYEAPVQQCQSPFLQKPPVTTQSSSNMFKTTTSSAQSINDQGYYMRERFSLLAKFWKLKQAYFTKRIQICNILKEKLSEASIAEHEGANILDGIINNAITNPNSTLRSPRITAQCTRDAFKVSEEVIAEVVDNVHKVFDARRGEDVLKSVNPPMCKRICRVNNELYRELFEKKAQAIQEKDLSRGKTLLAKTSEVNTTKASLSKPYQVVRDPRFHKKL